MAAIGWPSLDLRFNLGFLRQPCASLAGVPTAQMDGRVDNAAIALRIERYEIMRHRHRLGILFAMLLVPGMLAGAYIGGGNASGETAFTEKQRIVLNTGHCDGPHVRCRVYPLRIDGKADGQIVTVNGPIKDAGGDVMGRMREHCIYEGGVTHVCTQVFKLRSGPTTDRGSVVTTGVLGEWVEGLNGRFAVTGGTGAYAQAQGQATKVYDGRDFIFTLTLIP